MLKKVTRARAQIPLARTAAAADNGYMVLLINSNGQDMTRALQQFGSVTVSRVRTPTDLRQLLKDPWLRTDEIVIKPNWFSPHPANFTDVETLRVLLEALDSRATVIEAYSMER